MCGKCVHCIPKGCNRRVDHTCRKGMTKIKLPVLVGSTYVNHARRNEDLKQGVGVELQIKVSITMTDENKMIDYVLSMA